MAMRKRHRIPAIALLWGLVMIWIGMSFVGAAGDERPGRQTPKTAAIKIISNPKTPRPQAGKPSSLSFIEDLSIGVREGDENYMFGSQIYVNTDKDGNFYITDWNQRTIRKYDPQGKYLLNIGRPGQGPGEFQNIGRPEFDHEGNLYVSDYVGHKIIFFDHAGRFLRQILLPANMEHALMNRRGYFVGQQDLEEESPSGRKTVSVFGLFDGQSKICAEFQRTVLNPKKLSGSGEERMVNLVAGLLSDSAFKPGASYLKDPDDFVWFGYPEIYEIRVYAPDGRLDRSIRRDYDPRPITGKDKERYLKEGAEPLLNRPRLRPLKNKVYDRVQFPKFKCAYSSFVLMEDGGLAVIIEQADNGDTVFDLFDKDGRYVSHFQAPVPSEGLFFNNGKAYAIKTEDGYKFVKRYRLEIR
jgi:hypothetical protein